MLRTVIILFSFIALITNADVFSDRKESLESIVMALRGYINEIKTELSEGETLYILLGDSLRRINKSKSYQELINETKNILGKLEFLRDNNIDSKTKETIKSYFGFLKLEIKKIKDDDKSSIFED